MPDILIKNEVGIPVTYEGITSITVPTADGGTATFNNGIPNPTITREEMENFLNNGSPNYTVYSFTFEAGRLVSSNLADFGLWYVTDFDAIKIYDGNNWGTFRDLGDGIIISSNTGSIPGLLYFSKEDHTAELIHSGSFSNVTWTTIPTGYLLSNNSNSNILRFNSTTHAVDEVFTGRSGLTSSYEIDGVGTLLSHVSSTQYEILFYDYEMGEIVGTGINALYMSNGTAVPGGHLIFCSYSGTSYQIPICFFDIETKTLTSVYLSYNSYYWYTYQHDTGDGLLMGGNYSGANYYGILYFDYETKAITKVYSSDYYWRYFHAVQGGVLCTSTQNNTTGVVFFDTETLTATKIYTSGYYYTDFIDTGNGCVLLSNNTAGIIYYDSNLRTVTQVYTTGTWHNRCAVKGGCLFSSQNSSFTGVLFFDEDTKTVTKIWEVGYNWSLYRVSGGALVGSQQSVGFLFLDEDTKTITQIEAASNYWRSFLDVDGGCFISNTGNSRTPYFYKNSDRSFTGLSFSCTYLTSKVDVPGGALISTSSSTRGIWLYDNATCELTQIHDIGYNWTVATEVEGGLLLSGGTAAFGVVFYDYTTRTVTVIDTSGYNWNYVIDVGNGYLLTSTLGNASGIIYFDKTSKTGEQKYSKGWNWVETEWHTQGLKLYQKNAKFTKALIRDETEQIIIEV